MSFCPMVDAPPAKDKQAKVAIPHVITQFSPDGAGVTEKGVKEKKKKSNDTARTKHYAPSEVSLVSTTLSTSSQATPKSKRWNFEFRHKRHPSTETNVTPQSAVDTVFDSEIYELPASPNSSTKSSSGAFAVELEDTSQIALHSKRSAYPGQQLDFQSSATASRSVIKKLEQTIALIDDENRQLLSRAIAAEATVKALTQRNHHLQQRIEHCENNHLRRPRTVASQPSLRQQRNKQSPTTPQISNDQAQNLSPTTNTTQYPTRTSSHRIPETEPPKTVSPTALAIHPFPAGRHLPDKPLPSPPAESPSLPPLRSSTHIQHSPTHTQYQTQHSPTHTQIQAQQYAPSTPSQVQVQPQQQHQSSPTKSSPQNSPRRHSRRVSLFPAINSNNRPLMPEGRHGKQGPVRNPSIHGLKSEQVVRQNPSERSDIQGPRNDMQTKTDLHVRNDAQARNDIHSLRSGEMGLGINAEQIRYLEVDLATNERTFISGLFRAEEGEEMEGIKEREKRLI